MAETALVRKLQIRPGQRLLVLNAPAGYVDRLRPPPQGVTLSTRPNGGFDFVQLFVKNRAELDRLAPKAVKGVKHDGLLWICYPKGSAKVETDLNRDNLWKAVDALGLAGVSLISLDNVWSAMRFRPAGSVGKSARGRSGGHGQNG